ncbi:inosine-uridine nucleoside N-ribohydrolase [Scopulibacillus darangshiensis]|uniref:Inosine-uridine nucleoside N-ribohydrolase n=1 Tax=Scopulibacillus darangshiensis TaxID=442528 RepID=A0A4R2P589_9BACL|nr:nucleoside hydrolase [Scopulibacillus darangshiensis]TCP29942.1 inosine-uridine nucleoside N-ribohydrolase [Scopulibacillus darangshiensis]
MEKVIFDCDNTIGVPERDVDDGLALLYLLGREDIELIGVTTTFGNSTIDTVYEATVRMFDDLGLHDLPLLKGAGGTEDRRSESARFLAKTAAEHPGDISLLATGSLTNLYQAYQIDPDFFGHLKQIVLMGGITEPLVINGNRLNELNFSCDPEAALQVLRSEAKVTTLTGNICLQAFFGEKELAWVKQHQQEKVYQYILDKLLPWVQYNQKQFGLNGFYNWDTTAALYLTHPGLFDDNLSTVVSTQDDLKSGYLSESKSVADGFIVHVPEKIKDIHRFNQVILETWGRVSL